MSRMFDCRDVYSSALEELAESDPRIAAVVNDSVGSTKLGSFARKFPGRFVNVGIAEQNMVGVGAGLANGGMVPYVCAAACFLTARAMEQIKVDLGYSRSNVKLVGISPGLAYGELGPTHHSIEDVGWLRILPNLTIVVPADPHETRAAVRFSADHEGPVFLRISRMPVPEIFDPATKFDFGKAIRLRDGTDVTLIANGVLTHRVLDAADQLRRHGITARVLNMSTIKPIDRDAIVDAAQDTGAILTAEEHSVHGGLGAAVAEVVVETIPVRMRIMGVPSVFAPTGSAEFLLEHFGLTAASICAAAVELVRKRQ